MLFHWPRVRVIICSCCVLSVRSIVVSFGGIKNEKEPRETEENVKERKNDRFSKSQTSTQRRVASRRRQVDEPCFSRGFNDIDPSKFDRSFERLIFSRSTVSHPDLYRIGLSHLGGDVGRVRVRTRPHIVTREETRTLTSARYISVCAMLCACAGEHTRHKKGARTVCEFAGREKVNQLAALPNFSAWPVW